MSKKDPAITPEDPATTPETSETVPAAFSPHVFRLAAQIIDDAIFSSANISTNEANELRPLIAHLREVAEWEAERLKSVEGQE